ncbi:hypothetical protein QL285_018433 [Trifolium repens]|nr:hypothetical protein QL285_018433 [Trifolium repens]
MLSSQLVVPDLFSSSMYAPLTVKIPTDDVIHLCLSTAPRHGLKGYSRFSRSCSKTASSTERESFHSTLHVHTFWTIDPIIETVAFGKDDLRKRSGYKDFNVVVPIHLAFQKLNFLPSPKTLLI